MSAHFLCSIYREAYLPLHTPFKLSSKRSGFANGYSLLSGAESRATLKVAITCVQTLSADSLKRRNLAPLQGISRVCTPGGGGHSAHTHTGGQSKKFSGNPKISLQLQCNPKISAHFIYINGNLYKNIKYPQTMQIEVRIASIEPRTSI